MLKFKKLDNNSRCELCACYKKGNYILSDYSIGLKYMWREVLKPEFTVSKGCLITKNNINGTEYFDFPLPIDDESSIDGALDEISEYCRENYVVFRLSNVPENQLTHVTSRFPRCEITYNRKFSDYVYFLHTP
jgi:hypothetical protein